MWCRKRNCRNARLAASSRAMIASLDMHVSSLRRKLGSLSGGEERIKTVRGVGYQYTRS